MEYELADRIVIESVHTDGKPFRPSDWIERISTTLASFGRDHRLHYLSSVQPCIIKGEKCLVVDRNLEQKDPTAWAYILKFAEDNALRVQQDRRRVDEPVVAERRAS